jgi:hypothetical protein
MSGDPDHLGNPSEKFLEEKLKLSQVIIKMKQLEEAIPILHKLFKEQNR